VVNAPAGTYTFICDVPGHEEAGMVGTLTVEWTCVDLRLCGFEPIFGIGVAPLSTQPVLERGVITLTWPADGNTLSSTRIRC
jgi:hypothetical protein